MSGFGPKILMLILFFSSGLWNHCNKLQCEPHQGDGWLTPAAGVFE